MITRKGRDLAAGNQFSFASSKDLYSAGSHGRKSSPYGAEYGAWAERIKGDYGYFGKPDDRKLGAWTRRASFSHCDQGKLEDEDEERWLVKKEEGNGSGTPSPPLWKNAGGSPVAAARSADASPLHSHVPVTRAQEIARYRQEMLDLVRDLPDSGYELSLRDIVQPPTPPKTAAKAEEGAPDAKKEAKDKKQKINKGMKQIIRSESMEAGGFLLKMFTPASMAGGGRRRSSGGSNSFAKVSPRPPAPMAEGEKVGREIDGEWWKKNEFSGSGGSTTSSSSKSSRSSSNSSSKSRGGKKGGGCYSFFLKTQSGAKEI